MNKSKILSKFTRDGENITRILESNFKIGESNHLRYWDGVHTIRLEALNKKDDEIILSGAIELSDRTVFKGYIESSDAKILHFLGNRKKLIKNVSSSYYHAMADDLAEIAVAIKAYPKSELIIGVGDIIEHLGTNSYQFFAFFLSCLDKEGIKYTLVDFSKFDVLYIENFYDVSFPFHSGARLDILADFFTKHLGEVSEEPTRKIYVSRAGSGWKGNNPDAANFSYKDDNRIDSHEEIEKLFIEMGFEVVVPENFSSFEEQLDCFRSAKVIASLTSSGLTNAIFMKPGGTIIEIATPLITKSPHVTAEYLASNFIDTKKYDLSPVTVQELHMFYHNLAFFKELLYVSIPNNDRDSKKLREFINANQALKDLLTNE